MFLISSGITGYSSTQSILKLIGLIILCILIIAASYFVTRFIGNSKAGGLKSANFEALDAYRLSPNKYLQLIRIGSKFLVIAVCKDTVTYLCELEESEIEKNVHSSGGMGAFKDILANSLKKGDRAKEPEKPDEEESLPQQSEE